MTTSMTGRWSGDLKRSDRVGEGPGVGEGRGEPTPYASTSDR